MTKLTPEFASAALRAKTPIDTSPLRSTLPAHSSRPQTSGEMVMDPLLVARNAAMSTSSGSPPYFAALAICHLRGIDPNLWMNMSGMQNWQQIVAETVLQDIIAKSLRP